jgi:hypothetical protein
MKKARHFLTVMFGPDLGPEKPASVIETGVFPLEIKRPECEDSDSPSCITKG